MSGDDWGKGWIVPPTGSGAPQEELAEARELIERLGMDCEWE